MPARGRASGASQDAPDTSREAPIDVDEQQDVEMHVERPMGEQALPGPFEREDGYRDDHGASLRGGHSPEPLLVSEPSTWQRWPDVQPAAPVNNQYSRERAVESLIQSERGQRWLDEISQGLRLSGNLRELLHRRIRFLFIQGRRVVRDLGMVDVDDQLIAALDTLLGDVPLAPV